MPLVGPTPVDWIVKKQQRQDEKLRTMMLIAQAAQQQEGQQQRWDKQAESQAYQDYLNERRTTAYEQSIADPRPAGPTELMRNYGFLQEQYPGKDVGPMIVPGMKEGTEKFSFDVDDWTAGDMEKTMGTPPGTIKAMHPRQRQVAYQKYAAIKHPAPDRTTSEWESDYGRQKSAIQDTLNRMEQRRSSLTAAMNAFSRANPETPVPDEQKQALRQLDAVISKVANYRETVAIRPLTEDEYAEYMKVSMGGGGAGYPPMVIKLAKEYGISEAEVQAAIKQATIK